jgi:hypothetical protein
MYHFSSVGIWQLNIFFSGKLAHAQLETVKQGGLSVKIKKRKPATNQYTAVLYSIGTERYVKDLP